MHNKLTLKYRRCIRIARVRMIGVQMTIKDRFLEEFILGKHPKMRILIAKFSGVQSKACTLSQTFATEEEMIRGLHCVAQHLFTVKVEGGRRTILLSEHRYEKILIFLIFLYGIRFWCESKSWFDLWYLIDNIEPALPPFEVPDLEAIMAQPTSEQLNSMPAAQFSLSAMVGAMHLR